MKIFALFWNLDGRPNRVYATSFILRQSRQSVANGARRGEHNRAKHGDEEVEIEVKMRGEDIRGDGCRHSPWQYLPYPSSGWVRIREPRRRLPHGVAAVRSESAVYWRAGSHRASAAGKALGPDSLGSRGNNLPTRPEHGVVLARINPFGTTVDPTKFVASGLTADPRRQYLLQHNPTEPFQSMERRISQLAYGKGFNSRRGR
jgi:hypothetical protein